MPLWELSVLLRKFWYLDNRHLQGGNAFDKILLWHHRANSVLMYLHTVGIQYERVKLISWHHNVCLIILASWWLGMDPCDFNNFFLDCTLFGPGIIFLFGDMNSLAFEILFQECKNCGSTFLVLMMLIRCLFLKHIACYDFFVICLNCTYIHVY